MVGCCKCASDASTHSCNPARAAVPVSSCVSLSVSVCVCVCGCVRACVLADVLACTFVCVLVVFNLSVCLRYLVVPLGCSACLSVSFFIMSLTLIEWFC